MTSKGDTVLGFKSIWTPADRGCNKQTGNAHHRGGQGSSNDQCDNAHMVTLFLRGF